MLVPTTTHGAATACGADFLLLSFSATSGRSSTMNGRAADTPALVATRRVCIPTGVFAGIGEFVR